MESTTATNQLLKPFRVRRGVAGHHEVQRHGRFDSVIAPLIQKTQPAGTCPVRPLSFASG